MRRKLLVTLGAVALVLGGVAVALVLEAREKPTDRLDTELEGISYVEPERTVRPTPRKRQQKDERPLPAPDRLCWPNFGRDPQRTLALTSVRLGRPTKALWARGMRDLIEFPPVYCDGHLYVNTNGGTTAAIDSRNGQIVWSRRSRGAKPSSPAIAGPRLIVTSIAGTVTAYLRKNGRRLWQLRTNAKIESSPVVVSKTVYVGSHDGRVFALSTVTGRVRWAYDTGGRINSSPSIVGNKVCITTYAGSIFCLRRTDGRRLWRKYLRRDPVRYESFYASASTDGKRLFTVARSGKVVALWARTGRVLWTARVRRLGYPTPAVANGRVFVGGTDGTLHAFRSTSGRLLWKRRVGGRILGAALVVGDLVFFSTLDRWTYAARTVDGRIVWRRRMGQYAPGIATDRHYYFSLNGLLVAFRGARSAPELPVARAAKRAARPRRTR